MADRNPNERSGPMWLVAGTRGGKSNQSLKNTEKEVPGDSGEGRGAKREASLAPVERLLYGRKEAAIALSISPRAVDYELAKGAFETRRYGTRVLITARSLKKWANTNHYEVKAGRELRRFADTEADQKDKAA